MSFIIQKIYQWFVLLSVKKNLSIVWGGGHGPLWPPLDPPLPGHDRETCFLIRRHHLTWWRHLDIALSRISWLFSFFVFFSRKHKKLQILELSYMFSRSKSTSQTKVVNFLIHCDFPNQGFWRSLPQTSGTSRFYLILSQRYTLFQWQLYYWGPIAHQQL